MSYRFLEHTSDLIIEGEGTDFPAALSELAKGMFTRMGSGDSDENVIIESSAETREGLIVSFLTDVILECETMPFTPAYLEVLDYGGGSIRCRIFGERTYPENIIKGVTHHDLEILENEKTTIKVLFDI